MQPDYQLLVGDCRDTLTNLEDQSVHCCVTSPPYFGLRDYGNDGQIGLEGTPGEYIDALVSAFREVWRVLRDDGTVWLNLGDSYVTRPHGSIGASTLDGTRNSQAEYRRSHARRSKSVPEGLKHKDLIGIPWRVAFALQEDGWYLRQDIIWAKPNPMPESVRDRCTKAHEYLFLLSKGPNYYYDHEAVKEPAASSWSPDNQKTPDGWDTGPGSHGSYHKNGREKGKYSTRYSFARISKTSNGDHGQKPQHRPDREAISYDAPRRNRRSVWTIPTKPYKGAHFATFPPDLVEPCVLGGCPEGGTVLDPFGGSGTTAGVALALARDAIICELSEEYATLIPGRVSSIINNWDRQLSLEI